MWGSSRIGKSDKRPSALGSICTSKNIVEPPMPAPSRPCRHQTRTHSNELDGTCCYKFHIKTWKID